MVSNQSFCIYLLQYSCCYANCHLQWYQLTASLLGIEHLFDDEPRRKIKLHSRSKNMIEDSDEEDTIADFYEVLYTQNCDLNGMVYFLLTEIYRGIIWMMISLLKMRKHHILLRFPSLFSPRFSLHRPQQRSPNGFSYGTTQATL